MSQATALPSEERDSNPPVDRPGPVRQCHGRAVCLLILLVGALVVSRPMLPSRIPTHPMSDLPHHVRHVEEYRLALAERQVPPLVAPLQNFRTRGAVFQYYGGTAYIIPGMLALLGLNPYRALGLGVFLQVLVGGVFMFRTGRALGASPAASLLAAVAFEVFPYAGADLYARGGYTQVTAYWALPLVFYCMLRLTQSRGWPAVRYFCLAALAWSFFIPQHPIQTVMCACVMLFLLAGYVAFDRREPWREKWTALLTPTMSMLGGLAASAWFCYAILRDYGRLRITPHKAFLDAGLSSMRVLLWPEYREPPHTEWAPQLGTHFALAAVIALVLFRRTRALGVFAALGLAALVGIIGWHEQMPWLERLLAPVQWSYRLMIPAGFLGAVALVVAFSAATTRLPGRAAMVLTVVLLVYVLAIAPKYYRQKPKYGRLPVAAALDPAATLPDSLGYALLGADYAQAQRTWAPGGVLRTDFDIRLPRDCLPFEARLVLRREGAGAGNVPAGTSHAGGEVRVRVDTGRGWDLRTTVPADGDEVRLAFSVDPSMGLETHDQQVRFETTPPGTAWRLADLTVHVRGDPPEAVVHTLAGLADDQVRRDQRGARAVFRIRLEPGQEGLYQIPVCHLPSNGLKVNGRPASPASLDQFLTIVPLSAGPNTVEIRTRPTTWAWALSVATSLTCVALAVGIPLRDRAARRRRALQPGPGSETGPS
jgi:hypothetical protein